MDPSLGFARHFARLVEQLLNDRAAYDVQLASLQLLVSASREGPVILGVREWRLVVNGRPVTDQSEELRDLAAQLIGHSVIELTVDRTSSPADILLAARILASEPVPGDGGRNVLARLDALGATGVRARVEELRLRRAPEGGIPNSALAGPSVSGVIPDATYFAPTTAQVESDTVRTTERIARDAAALHADAELVRGQRLDHMYEVFSASDAPKGSLGKLFERLDAARTSRDAARQLDALVAMASESAAKRRYDLVADIFHGLARREATVEDLALRRQYGVFVRRLCVPPLLRAVAALLPHRRDAHDQHMAIFARAEDAGAESLVEALIEAPSIAYRRVYYDALLGLGSGTRTLIHMLADPRWYVVRNAAELLGEMREVRAGAALTRLLEHRDDRVRAAAAGALAKLGAPGVEMRGGKKAGRAGAGAGEAGTGRGSVNSLIRALDREGDERVQLAMISALGKIGTAPAVEKLITIAETEGGRLRRRTASSLRVAAVQALAESSLPAAAAALASLRRAKDPAVRGAASWAVLGRKGSAKGKREPAGKGRPAP